MATSPSSLLLHPLGSASGKIIPASHQCVCSQRIQGLRVSCSKLNVRVKASRMEVTGAGSTLCNRRDIIGCSFGLSSVFIGYVDAKGAGLPPEEKPKLCDSACEKELENVPMVTTESGLQYKDIKIGAGPSPPVGFQVAANYVAMVPSGPIFDRQAC